MGHKTYISFKAEDADYKDEIQSWGHLDYVDKSLNSPINSIDPDYILRKIREDYLRDSTVTVFLIGTRSSENLGAIEQQYIKGELQASLYNGGEHSKNGILGVVLPDMVSSIFGGDYQCSTCGGSHRSVQINNSTVIKEFSVNYYVPPSRCAWSEEQRYCKIVAWSDFRGDPNSWIDAAYEKRSQPIADKTTMRP